MREKVIYDGRIDGSEREVQKMIDFFLFQNIGLPEIDYRIEKDNQKQLYVIYPHPEQAPKNDKIINGYTEITTLSISEQKPINLRIVSCRSELDLLFFHLSQQIQAKFIIEGFPPDGTTLSWRELVSQGLISPLSTTTTDVLLSRIPNPEGEVPRFGSDRDLTESQVIEIVSRCNSHRERGATIAWYYDHLPTILQDKFSLGTLKDWVKDPRFYKAKKLPRKLPH
jgi:hypothetical protein